MTPKAPSLEIVKCPVHDYWAVIIDADGTGGYRLTPSKCCGQWSVVRTWALEAHAIEQAQDELRRAKRRLKRREAR